MTFTILLLLKEIIRFFLAALIIVCSLCVFLKLSLRSRPRHAKPEKFENGVFIVKTHPTSSVISTPEKFENGVFPL